jgi:hypothetical protein
MKLFDILVEIDEEILGESTYKYVIRQGKKIRRKKPKKGYKVVGKKYVKMSSRERMKRKIAQRKAAKKRKAKKSQANRKRRISMRKRKAMGVR